MGLNALYASYELALGVLAGAAAVLGPALVVWRRSRTRRRREFEHDQQERLKDLGVMAAGLAHEIRHPISAIQFALASVGQRLEALEPRETSQEVQDILESMGADVKRLEETVDLFLRYARPQAAEATACDVTRTCELVRRFLKVELAARGLQIRTHYDSDELMVHAPEVRLRQILVNLILNAADASEDGAAIDLRVGREGRHVVIEVEDTGHGVPDEVRERLFEPFVTTKPKGVGLGLALSRRLAEDMGACLAYRPGAAKGSVFSLELPLNTNTGPS